MRDPLLPREHGAYIQLFAPLATALVLRVPSVSAILIGVAATATFFGSEALLVLRGGRGARRRERDGKRAGKRARTCGAIAIASVGVGLVLAPRGAIELAGLVAIPASLALFLASRRRLHTQLGEVIAAIALAGAAAPVAAAAGVDRDEALVLWLAWSAGFATSVFAVHGVLARHRRPDAGGRLDAHVGAVIVLAALAWANPTAGVAVPLAVASAVVAGVRPSAKRLTTVGIALAISSVLSAAIAVFAI